MRRYVQAHHHPGCGNPDHPISENSVLWTIAGNEAGHVRFEEADRLSGLGHFVLDRLRDPVLDDPFDLPHLEMMSKASAGHKKGQATA
jgi:hypothetical protein